MRVYCLSGVFVRYSIVSEQLSDQENAPPLRWGWKKRLAVKLSLVAGGVLIGLLLAEVALRIVGFSFPTFYAPDQSRGYALRPGMAGWYRKEGETYVRINADGLRGREHAPAKPPGTFRIALLGDSYAEALQVEQSDAFWSITEGQLRQCASLGGREVEVINFGVSGYGTAQELITLRERVWQYEPDLVLLAVTTNNDVTDNSRALKKTDEIPYFTYRQEQLALDDSFRFDNAFRWRLSAPSRFGRWVRDSSRVIQAFHQAQYSLKAFSANRRARRDNSDEAAHVGPPLQQVANAAVTGPAAAEQPGDVGIDNLVYQTPRDEVWQNAWRVTEELLMQMRDEVESRGAEFLVVTLSNGIQVYPDKAAREAFMRRVGAEDLFYPDRRIKALGEREHFAVDNLVPELQAYADQHKVFLHGFGANVGNGHWNQLGHRIAGELLAHKLCESQGKQ